MKFKIGDRVRYNYAGVGEGLATVVEILWESFGLDCDDPNDFDHDCNGRARGRGHGLYITDDQVFPIEPPKPSSTGGPSAYYDFPFKDWVTLNDQIEYIAEHRWGKFSPALKDIFKALARWGSKEGTTINYDAKKIVYYGLRVLRQAAGTDAVRSYLKELLEDPQFGGKQQ